MKQFTRIDPTTEQTVGLHYKRTVLIKNFKDGNGKTHEFTTFGNENARAGAVIALTPDNKVVTLYQFRPGPERWMYDLPGGGFDDGEANETGALRELYEETGYRPAQVEYLGESCWDSYSNLTSYYFLATGCTMDDANWQLEQEEGDQGAEVQLISIAELIDNAKQSRMTDPRAVLIAYDKLSTIQRGTHD